MSNLAKLEFLALDITGKNYLSWVLDAEMHLNANNLGNTIKEDNTTSIQDKAKAMIFLRHHIHDDLKNEYLTVKDPLDLWTKLKERYDHQKTVILLRARYDWVNLRLQDFKTISEYNSAMFRITSQLILCGQNITDEDMMEKTFSTFHASNVLLQQQYHERGFTKYCDLVSYLLVAEQNNELLMKNHETRRLAQPHSLKRMLQHIMIKVEVVVVVVVMIMVVDVDITGEVIMVFNLRTQDPIIKGKKMERSLSMKVIKRQM
ncbi:uncharacterized protein LOC143626770 [Bidens hawaiensis]|uniref:uncharacterized protein LOC143626770 n=1 Tax=Bidens hawaiensis TaxID=980011 RepID=UPI004049639E